LAGIGEKAAAAPNPCIVEQQMDLVGLLLLDQLITKTLELILDRNVGDVSGDTQALRKLFDFTEPLGFGHRLRRDVAHRDITAFGDKLARQFAAHTRAASGDDGNLSCEVFHWDVVLFSFNMPRSSCPASSRTSTSLFLLERKTWMAGPSLR